MMGYGEGKGKGGQSICPVRLSSEDCGGNNAEAALYDIYRNQFRM